MLIYDKHDKLIHFVKINYTLWTKYAWVEMFTYLKNSATREL